MVKKRNDRMSPKNILLENKQTLYIKKIFNSMSKDISKEILKEEKSFEIKQDDILKMKLTMIITDWMIKIVNRIVSDGDKSIKNGNKYMNRTQKLWIDFGLIATQSIKYLEDLKDLHLSTRQWSITKTTVDWIIRILNDWLVEWLSYQEIAKNITNQTESWVFSLARSRMIAVNQIWKAYEFGKRETINEFVKETGTEYEKYWLTARDDRVTDTHRQNESDWWIDKNLTFSWTWDQEAPWSDNPRCRCTVLYRRKK